MSEKFELVSPDKQAEISGQIQNTEEIFSHGHQKVRYPLGSKEAYNEAVQNLASYSSNVAELRMNRRFHENLNLFEKWGLVSQGKQERHRRGVELKKEAVVAGVMAISHALPYLHAWHQEREKKREFRTNLVSWSAWIVEEENLAYRGKLENILEKNKVYDERAVRSVFEQHAGGELQKLPSFALDNPEQFFKVLTYLSDTGNPEQDKRVRALGKEGLGLPERHIEEAIRAAQGGQLTASDFATFNSNFITDYARDLFDSLPQAAQFANYIEANDPYRFGREARLQQLKSTGPKLAVGAVLGAITLTTGGVGDAIIAASGPLLYSLVGGDEVAKQFEFVKAYRGMLHDVKKIA